MYIFITFVGRKAMENFMNKEKYKGIIPALYACYDDNGAVSITRTRQLVRLMLKKGVNGLYVGGSSGECIYLSKEERKQILQCVMEEAQGKITVIAHVACNNTQDSMELARHADFLGVDAIAAIPPIYFKLPEHAIAKYWNDISFAAPNTDFIIYNIPQLAGVNLSKSLLETMIKNPRVIGVKNSSMPVMDIQLFKATGGNDFVVFNGPDEQLVSGLSMGAIGGIGGTYGVMPELYLKIYQYTMDGNLKDARNLQYKANEIITDLCSCHGNMYAVIKEVIRIRDGLNSGGVRLPLANITDEDGEKIKECANKIDTVLANL